MHTHTDKPCKHELKVCTHCGDVYCSKCMKEWYKEKTFTYSYASYPYTLTGVTYNSGNSLTLDPPEQPTAHTHQ